MDDNSIINEIGTISVMSNELYETGAYSGFDIIPHLGVEYSLSSHFHLGLNVNYGLKNLIARTQLDVLSSISKDDELYRRNISVKLRYKL